MRAFLLLTVFTALVTAKQCDRETECDDDATCCLLANKEWGCCPMKNAVCCEDHLHCCPEGSQCDVSAARCINQFSVSHLMKKKKARKIMVRQDPYNEEVICPDKISKCPQDTTCCLLEQGLYGCCPAPNATCCIDQLHCCPHGTRCEAGSCVSTLTGHRTKHLKNFSSTPLSQDDEVVLLENFGKGERDEGKSAMMKKKSARKVSFVNVHNEIICPDKVSKCPQSTTCCAISEGSYGCCPAPEAVCCEDKMHCCPHNTRCHKDMCINTLTGHRSHHLKKFKSTSLHRSPASSFYRENSDESSEEDETGVVICGYEKSCPIGNTCCKVPTEDGRLRHACCPFANGVCCEDSCCPNGFHCVKGRKCEKQARSFKHTFFDNIL